MARDQWARPILEVNDGGAAVIRIRGWVDGLTLSALSLACFTARRDERVREIMLSIDSERSVWNCGVGVAAIRELANRKPVCAVIGNALGSSYQLAAATRCIVACPGSQIGAFRAGASIDSGRNESRDRAIRGGLLCLRPAVDPLAWLHLLANTADGAICSGLGIVDWLSLGDDVLIRPFGQRAYRLLEDIENA